MAVGRGPGSSKWAQTAVLARGSHTDGQAGCRGCLKYGGRPALVIHHPRVIMRPVTAPRKGGGAAWPKVGYLCDSLTDGRPGQTQGVEQGEPLGINHSATTNLPA